MSSEKPPIHPVALRRKDRGWSQAELAERAGLPRTTLSAIESRRLTPSVAAALAVSGALGEPVENLFGGGESPCWAWKPAGDKVRYCEARLGNRLVAYPVESVARNAFVHDGIWRTGQALLPARPWAEKTLVVACCDPSAGLLAAELARAAGVRLFILERGGLAALDLLRRGLVHLAGLHFATAAAPNRNREITRRELGAGYRLMRSAAWEEGIVLRSGEGKRATGSLLKRGIPWALRETGSAARDCFDGLLEGRREPEGRVVPGHEAVAASVRDGWAGAGVCVRLAAEEAGLAFRSVREEYLDFCVAESNLDDPRIEALGRVLRSREHRRVLDGLPGYDARQTGELRTV